MAPLPGRPHAERNRRVSNAFRARLHLRFLVNAQLPPATTAGAQRHPQCAPRGLARSTDDSAGLFVLWIPELDAPARRGIPRHLTRLRPVHLGNERRLMRGDELEDARRGGDERPGKIRIRCVPNHQHNHLVGNHSSQLVGLVANARVMGDDNPAAGTSLAQPHFVGGIWQEVVVVPLDLQPGVSKDRGELEPRSRSVKKTRLKRRARTAQPAQRPSL